MRKNSDIYLYEHDAVYVQWGKDDPDIIIGVDSAYSDALTIHMSPAHLYQLKRGLKDYEGRKKDA